jgi:putative GTP pyrophosphokinase
MMEFLGRMVLVFVKDSESARWVGEVRGISKKREVLILHPYRIPDGLFVQPEHKLGTDFHLAPMRNTVSIPLAEIRDVKAVNVNIIEASAYSRSRIDALGERIRRGALTRTDLRLLDAWRREYRPAYLLTVSALEGSFGFTASGRPAKTTGAISEKLIRQNVRLSQMQDIAGCRVIVKNLKEQDSAVADVTKLFAKTRVYDRRASPSHGYRAVHITAQVEGRPVEIQIRTELQHRWAELSQKLADVVDKGIKYGEGHAESLSVLSRLSLIVARIEETEAEAQAPTQEVIDLMAEIGQLAEAT